MPIRTSHFEVLRPEGNVRAITVPGISGKIYKRLSKTLPIIVQTGICDPDATTRAAIELGRGDPTQTQTVDALLHGVFTNCWKQTAKLMPLPTGYNDPAFGSGKIRYEIRYEVKIDS